VLNGRIASANARLAAITGSSSAASSHTEIGWTDSSRRGGRRRSRRRAPRSRPPGMQTNRNGRAVIHRQFALDDSISRQHPPTPCPFAVGRQPPCTADPSSSRTTALTSAHTDARDRSTVEHELALRPEFSARARMPPTARPAPRGERPRLLVLTAGRCRTSTGVTPPGLVAAPRSDRPPGVLALFLPMRTRQRDGMA
jgi:hypothetical protein